MRNEYLNQLFGKSATRGNISKRSLTSSNDASSNRLRGIELPTPGNNQLNPNQSGGLSMLGERISETKGKRLLRRVISVDPPTAEVSFEDAGNVSFTQ
jgi:hypothetical protein